MRIIRTSLEKDIGCDACGSRIGLVPRDVKLDGPEGPYCNCPACGFSINLTDQIPPKWEDFLRARADLPT